VEELYTCILRDIKWISTTAHGSCSSSWCITSTVKIRIQNFTACMYLFTNRGWNTWIASLTGLLRSACVFWVGKWYKIFQGKGLEMLDLSTIGRWEERNS